MIKKLILLFIGCFDFFHKKKIIFFLKKKLKSEIIIIDVGAHHGESIKLFLNNFNVKKIFSFEASKENYKVLEKNIKKKFFKFKDIIFLQNYAIGNDDKKIEIKRHHDSSSSTIKDFNFESKYLKKKNKFLNLKKNDFYKKEVIDQIKLCDFLKENKIKKIDLLKIDTEGYEFEVLMGLSSKISDIDYVLFEHHYDNMIEKGYKFSDINELLIKNNFLMIFKIKMPFRKTFEYIYKNNT